MLEALRLADSGVRISLNVFDQLMDARENLRVASLPKQVLIPRLRREGDVHAPSFSFFRITLPRFAASNESSKRLAFAGERSKYAVS